MNVEWTDHVKSPGVIVERRQKYYITAVTLAALITRLCIAGSNAPSWQNRTRNWRTCDSWLNEIGVVWWRWTLIVTTSAGVWRQRWHCIVWSQQQSDECDVWRSDGVSSHYCRRVDRRVRVRLPWRSVPVKGDWLPALLVVWSGSFGRGCTSEGSSLCRLQVVLDANRLSSTRKTFSNHVSNFIISFSIIFGNFGLIISSL